VNLFDDLADPLGPPEGDALGRVLARARRRRAGRRSAAAFAGVIAVVAIAASANALRGSGSSGVHVANQSSTVPGPKPTPAPTTTSVLRDTTPDTTPAAGDGRWSDRLLTVTPRSLGAARVGMTRSELQHAVRFSFDAGGDGSAYPTTLPDGFPHDYVGLTGPSFKEKVVCVGASLTPRAGVSSQTISTPEGFRLGDSVRRLLAVYGSRARYVPAPSSGMTTHAGYVVAERGGYLAFIVGTSPTNWLAPADRTSGIIVEIAGSITPDPLRIGRPFGPNSCPG
jgi:hypothetical protein